MGSSKTYLNCAKVNELDLVHYLAELGYQPEKITGYNYWYLSPLHAERTASFKVNRSINRWYDFGIGKGGKLVDFGIRYFNCSVKAFLDSFAGNNLAIPPVEALSYKPTPRIEVIASRPLTSPVLLNYLLNRGIDIDLAVKYCQQVYFTIGDKQYFGIGFKNDKGGYEIRNPIFKSCSSPKGVTTFKNGARTLSVFEGFIDFLSFFKLFEGTVAEQTDYLILNSLSFFDGCMNFMQAYSKVFLYLDNDKAGQQCTTQACKSSSIFINCNGVYRSYKDLNDLLLRKGFPPMPTQTAEPEIPK